MAFASARLLFVPLCPTSSAFPFKPSATAFLKLPLSPPKSPHSPLGAASSHSQPPSPFTSEQAFLEAVVDFDASGNSLPAVRTYENDLARLTLVGAVDFQQALTAAAADGGDAADEHLSSGLADMVVETLFPGPADDHSTIATRLFLPSREVKEKAIKLKKKLPKDILRGTTSNNILAMTFRQVVMQHLRSLELEIFIPGTERNMKSLGNPREVPVLLTLSSSDERVISEVAEVVCVAAFEETERHFLHDSMKRASSRVLSWFNKHEQISSTDCSVVMYNILEHEILANTRILLEKFTLERGRHKLNGAKLKKSWWTSTAFSKLEKIGGPEFCVWISEFVPSYRLEIDSNKLGNLKLEGWTKSDANRWEIFLTHSQMVGLADVLDIYCEDIFTLPNKRLSSRAVAKTSNFNLNKSNSFFKMLSVVLVSGILLVMISVLGKLCPPHLPIRKNFIQENSQASVSEVNCVPHCSVGFPELEMCCVSIIKRMKDSFGWPGEIRTNSGVCAWIGELPNFLRKVDDTNTSMLDISSISIPLTSSEEEMKALEDIASYQVVVSSDGSIVGFQPTNRVAVNNWASNPLAKVLHGGKNLSPGLLEPGLEISRPSVVVVLELLVSSNPRTYFAMLRAVDVSERAS